MCARGFGGSDSCTGDSGGPLMARHGTAWQIEGADYFDHVVTNNHSLKHYQNQDIQLHPGINFQIFDSNPGIVSYGTQGCDSSLPGVYTRSHFLLLSTGTTITNHKSQLTNHKYQITNHKGCTRGVIICQLAQQSYRT